MRKITTAQFQEYIEVAAGRRPADLCLDNARLVNVFSGLVEEVDLAIHQGLVVGRGNYQSHRRIDAAGHYLAPGFIDGHLHLESTLLSPAQFCAAVLPWGTTTVIADPHEIANVLGVAGIRYLLAATAELPIDIYFNLPSCVPASPFETSGATLRASDLHSLLPHPRLLGLAEMMNFPGVIQAVPEILDKLVLFQDRPRDGHAPGLSGMALNSYLVTGIDSDHECTTLAEAREKLAKGMVIMLREGSRSKDLARLLPLVDQNSWPRCLLVRDDLHPDDLLREGHMNALVNQAMALGLDPVLALRLATATPAWTRSLPRLGGLGPGYQADFTLSPTLQPWLPQRVFKRGQEVARDGRLLADARSWPQPAPPASPMALLPPQEEQLGVPVQPGLLKVIGVEEGTLLTRKLLLPPKVREGQVVVDLERDILKLAVYNRYQPDCPPAVGFVQGFGLKDGALASTVAHDSHNLLVLGTSDAAMVRVAEAVRQARGGLAIGAAAGPLQLLPLPIAGLMSDWPMARVVEQLALLNNQARAWGSLLNNPFMALAFLALPVIPELKMTDRGLVEVTSFALVPLFE